MAPRPRWFLVFLHHDLTAIKPIQRQSGACRLQYGSVPLLTLHMTGWNPDARLGPSLVGCEPRPLKDLVDLLHTQARRLRDHQKDIAEGDKTPPGKEDKGAPVVRVLQQ